MSRGVGLVLDNDRSCLDFHAAPVLVAGSRVADGSYCGVVELYSDYFDGWFVASDYFGGFADSDDFGGFVSRPPASFPGHIRRLRSPTPAHWHAILHSVPTNAKAR
jgi:hypothetical protein